ncbi:MAG: hypothetical protein CMJ65_10115 [Planctomycetaceae bacterium]|nr:hypothetical protein [Planctomycetaceae bacterium]
MDILYCRFEASGLNTGAGLRKLESWILVLGDAMRGLLVLLLIVGGAGCGDGLSLRDGDSAGLPTAGPPPTGAPPIGSLRLNELVASNRADRLDDEGQSSDWIEIHNSGSQPLRLGGYHLTNDLKVLDKWAFPNNRITAGGFQIVWMSGLDRVSASSKTEKTSAVAMPFETTLIESGADWKYLVRTLDEKASKTERKLPDGWATVGFDDSEFAVGPAGFGFGDEDDATEIPRGTTVVLTRREFVLDEPLASESLVLQVDYDDGFIAYLNGTRVVAVNPPETELDFGSVANGLREAGLAERFDLSRHFGLLRTGKNVLAIVGLNTSRGSSDMSLEPALGTLPTICHANFRLKKSGETLYLIAPDGNIADQVRFPRQMVDQSLGRIAATKSGWGYFLTPSPGRANVGPQQSRPVTSRLWFDPEPGAFRPGIEVRINQQSTVAAEIRFTNDGSDPDHSSPLFGDPVKIAETSLFRAAAFVGKERASQVVSATYLIGPRTTLPVMSISMKPADFLDVHLQSSATGRSSERPAFLEVFDPEGKRTVATGFGLRLHGGAGRRGDLKTKKSYRTYFRKVYGQGRVDYPIIPEAGVADFDKLVLRANSNDRSPHGSNIRDQVIRDVHTDMGALAAGGSWCVLLINSASRGVYNVTERMDEEFFASHLGPGAFDVMKTGDTVLSGNRKGWDDLRRFIESTDFSDDANFKELAQRVDIEDFTSYIIVNLCLQNFDWPHNNWYAARRVPDGKWIFLCWDSEWGLGYRHPGLGDAPYGVDVDPYAFMDSGGAYGRGLIRSVFLALIDNPGYCEYYQKEVRRHLKGALSISNIMRHIHRHRDAIASGIDTEFQARRYDKKRWHKQLEEVERFARLCPGFFQKYTDEYFSHRDSASGEERVAMIEGVGGRRHVIYRTAKGQLHELSSSIDGSGWSDEAIRIPATAPPATGRPSVYSLAGGDRHVLYRGTAGHLHELLLPVDGGKDDVWQHTNLTSLLEQPVARCDPSVSVVDGVPHIVYVDKLSRPREFWFDGKWHHHPLPAAPRPASDVVISSTPSAFHVTYRSMFGVPCEQVLSRRAAADGQRNWSHRIFHRLPAQGQPLGFNAGGKRRIVYRVAEKWPVREPFVFRWHARRQPGFREYEGGRNTLVQAWNNGERFHRLESIGKPLRSVAGNPCVVYDAKGDQHYVAYRDADGHIQEANRNADSWQLIDATTLAGAPPAAAEPAGIVSARTGSRYYVYLARDGHLHELCFDGSWTHRDLSATVLAGSK